VTQVIDRSGRIGANYSKLYIDNGAPQITIRSPDESARLEGGFVPDVEFADKNLVDSYLLFRDQRYSPGEAIDLTDVPEGAYVLRAVGLDALGRSAYADREVFVDSMPPRIEVTTPGSGATLKGELRVLAWIGDGSGIRSASLIVDGYQMVPGVLLSTDGLYSFTVDLTPMNMSMHRFQVSAMDRSGLVAYSVERSFINQRHDTDGDGVLDPYDDAPRDPRITGDLDGDGFGSLYDNDDDGDGVRDIYEPTGESLNPDYTKKGLYFAQDPAEWMDTDMDGIGNNADPDDDEDGIPDQVDVFPLNSTESRDTDLDGIGDNFDPDIDGDGVVNTRDDLPFDGAEWRDTDHDHVGDNADDDDDGDGVVDSRDDFPKDRHRQYFWEPVILVLLVVLLCSMIMFIGMVFRGQISSTFDRSWEGGRLYRWRTGIREKLSREKEEDQSDVHPPRKGRPPAPPATQATAKKAAPSRPGRGRGPKGRVGTEEAYREEKVGSHRVRWSSK